MDTTFLLPVLDELFAAFGRGVMKGVTEELANPTAPLLPAPAGAPAPLPSARAPRVATAGRPALAGLTTAPAVGAPVRYRQGRGAFDATVLSVDAERSIATVKRTTDGREVIRPFAKLMPGAQPAPSPAAPQAQPSQQPASEAAAQ
ncbi:MAG TPA: hypothetical protein VFV33_14585 [Gemmatimonadaceae bacterium]|nr:hypothetical protein [Gemmatimonadaceae bacterium]